MKIQLTKLETEILRHRLTVPDALVEALTDVFPGDFDPKYHPQDIEDIIEALETSLNTDMLDTAKAEDRDIKITHVVLADCVEGSTWVSSMKGNQSSLMISKHIKAGESLAKKIGEYVGNDNLQFPCY